MKELLKNKIMSEYKDYTIKELKDLAKELNIPGINKLDKASLISKIEEANGIHTETEKIKPVSTEEKNSHDFNEALEEVDKLLDEEEKKKSIKVVNEIKEEVIEERKIDLSEEVEIQSTEDLLKEINNIPIFDIPKTSNKTKNDFHSLEEEEIIESFDDELIQKVSDEEVLKPAYQASMLTEIVLKEIPKATYYETLKEFSLKEEGLRRLLNEEFKDGEPYTEEQKNIFLNDFLKDFKYEIKRLLKIKEIKPVELTIQHKKWIDYLKIYKLTVKEYLTRYPNHANKDLLLDIVKWEENQNKK